MITNTGLRLGERYVLEERLAVGGMGEVWSALDETLNRPVAVKVLRDDLAPDGAFQARFRAEARTAAALSHGGIAAVYDYGEEDGSAYLVMELVPGEPLSAMIANEGALGTDRTLQIVSQAARALHAAHRHGVIHRDIKPANLMVTPELRVKVTDFGIARPRDHEPLTATGQVMGTAHYLAPELARGEIASPLSDVYALGVVAYECLAGWRPFDGDNQIAVATAHLQDEPPPLPGTVPAAVRNIVTAAMAKNPAHRPQGANALAALMEDARLRSLGGNLKAPAANAAPAPAPARPSPTRGRTPDRGAADWPADAATPPRGSRSSGRPDRAGQYGAPGEYESPFGRPVQPDPYGPAAQPVSRRDARDPRRHDPREGIPGYPGDPGYPAAAFAGGHGAGGGPAHAHGRPTGPDTSVIPKVGGRPSRKLTVPLMALLALVVLVVIAGLLAHHGGSDHGLGGVGPSRPAPGSGATVTVARADTSGTVQLPVLVRLAPAGPGVQGSPVRLLGARVMRETGSRTAGED